MFVHGVGIFAFDDEVGFLKTLLHVPQPDLAGLAAVEIKDVALRPYQGRTRLHRLKGIEDRRLLLDLQLDLFQRFHRGIFIDRGYRGDALPLEADVLRGENRLVGDQPVGVHPRDILGRDDSGNAGHLLRRGDSPGAG